MADVSAQDLRKLFDEIKGMNRGFSSFTKHLDDREDVYQNLLKSMEQDRKERKRDAEDDKRRRHSQRQTQRYDGERKADRISRMFSGLGGGIENASRAIKSFSVAILGGFGGGLVSGLSDFSVGLTKTYTELSGVGQTFGGDMIQMASDAAKAGMTLDDFAAMLKKSSVTAAAMAKSGQSLPMLAKSVRDVSAGFGMFGYNIRDLDDITATYADQLRLSGKLDQMDRTAARDQIKDLAKNAAGLSTIFGKSRLDIVKTWDSAMHHEQILAAKMGMTADEVKNFDKSLGQAIMTLSAQPGKLGEMLSQMAAEAAGAGTSVYSAGAKTFVDAGMGQVVAMMDEMNNRIKEDPDHADEATVDMMHKLKASIQENLPALKAQALAGNQAAAEVIRMGAEMKDVSVGDIKKAREEAAQHKKFTDFMLTLENTWNNVTGKIRAYLLDRFGDTIEKVAGKIDEFVKSDQFTKIMQKAEEMGTEALKWLGIVFNGDGSVNYEETSKKFVRTLDEIGSTISSIASVLKTVGDGLSGFGSILKTITGNGESSFPNLLVGLGGAAAAFIALKATLTGLSSLAGMMINAKVVEIISGSGVPGGGGAGGPGGGKKGSRLGKMARGLGAITAVGTAAEIASSLGGGPQLPSMKDLKEHTGRSFIEMLDPGLANLIYGQKSNTPNGTFDPSKVESTPMNQATGWLREQTKNLFGASAAPDANGPVPGVPRDQGIADERERLRKRQEELSAERDQSSDHAEALRREIRGLKEAIERGNQQAATDAQRVIDQNRRTGQTLSDSMGYGP